MFTGALLVVAVAGQSLGPPASASRANSVADVLEVLVRVVAAENCASKVCYVTVDGVAPSVRLLDRLTHFPHVQGMPKTGLPAGERQGARIIDLGPVHFASATRAGAGASVSDDWAGTGTFTTSDSCRYHFERIADRWDLRQTETACMIF